MFANNFLAVVFTFALDPGLAAHLRFCSPARLDEQSSQPQTHPHRHGAGLCVLLAVVQRFRLIPIPGSPGAICHHFAVPAGWFGCDPR